LTPWAVVERVVVGPEGIFVVLALGGGRIDIVNGTIPLQRYFIEGVTLTGLKG